MKRNEDIQPFEYFPNLEPHIQRMASTGSTGSLSEWNDFLSVLNAVCARVINSDKAEISETNFE